MKQRRDFIKQTGMIAAGLAVAPSLAFCTDAKAKAKPIGIQLYTLREQLKDGVPAVIQKIAEAGYTELETFGYNEGKYFGQTVAEFKKLLDDHGLYSPSGHYMPMDFLKPEGTVEDFKSLIEVGQTMNHEHIIIPWLPPEMRTQEVFMPLAEKMNKAGALCKDAGMKLAYHNHDFEFETIDGKTIMDMLIQNTDPDLVDFEMDIYWVVRAGHDPVKMFTDNPGRFTYWHVKDMHKTENTKNTEIGSGSINFKDIFANSELSGIKHYIVEQENFDMDPYQSIKQSFDYVQNDLM
jgi:sugar phosphate isomerase/epimerase